MKVGAVILCRYDSTRLFGKALRVIYNKPILEWISIFIKQAQLIDDLCVATSVEESDDPIAEFCKNLRIPCFRGSKVDVADRFLQCAKSNDFDYAFRVNGDNLFVQPSMLTDMVRSIADEQYDLVSNVPGRSYPFGMSAELVRVEFYDQVYRSFKENRHHEHVTLYLYENTEVGNRRYFTNEKWTNLAGVQLAIDTIEDVHRAERVFKQVGGDFTKVNFELLERMAQEGLLI